MLQFRLFGGWICAAPDFTSSRRGNQKSIKRMGVWENPAWLVGVPPSQAPRPTAFYGQAANTAYTLVGGARNDEGQDSAGDPGIPSTSLPGRIVLHHSHNASAVLEPCPKPFASV
ncbi:unnamed protein product [Clonostachys chloroleuca]|uniref:Uncharacterized protein n=1 Tax=Clonostachys chloroleuca TaxID=1926264 RepID=A0AA35Q824_9HYPO|nr:unnamed protein product [Clonostachys chloroleuca]